MPHVRERKLPREEICALLDEQASELHSGGLVHEKIRLLQEPGTAVVLTFLRPSLLGGPLCLLLRCLTAAKLASELSRSGLPSVPMALFEAERGGEVASRPISLLNTDSKLTRLSLDSSVEDGMEGLLGRIQELTPGGIDSESLEILRSATLPCASVAAASAVLQARLLDHWGLLLLDVRKQAYQILAARALAPLTSNEARTSSLLRDQSRRLEDAGYDSNGCGDSYRLDGGFVDNLLVQSSILPAAAVVVGSSDIRTCCLALPLFQELDLESPLLWPRASATIVDARNRKILERYKITLEDLFSGTQKLLLKTGLEDVEKEGTDRLDGLITAIDAGIRQISALAPEDGLGDEARSSQEKIIYQLGKLKERFGSAIRLRREAALRQLERACNTLAPESRPQECELSALHFLLRYSRAFLPQIYEKIDVWYREHQIIDVE